MNIVLLLGKNLDEYQIRSLELIMNDSAFQIKLGVINDLSDESKKEFLKKKFNKGKKAYHIFEKLQTLLYDNGETFSAKDFISRNNIDVLTTSNPGNPENISIIESYFPDIFVLYGGFSNIPKKLLNLCPYGILSYHFGDLRKYRGEPPAFWELYNGKKEMIVTVQKLTERIHCGLPVLEKAVEINFNDDLKSLRKKAFQSGENMMVTALRKVQEKDFIPEIIKLYGRIYHIPNMKEYSTLTYRIASRKLQHKFQAAVHARKNEPNYI